MTFQNIFATAALIVSLVVAALHFTLGHIEIAGTQYEETKL